MDAKGESGLSDDIVRTHRQEIRRGIAVLASLIALREPGYGYALLGTLADHGVEVDANTLYPLLRRLEDQGLLVSEWSTEESRPRKVYETSQQGQAVMDMLLEDLAGISKAITSLQVHPNKPVDQTEGQNDD